MAITHTYITSTTLTSAQSSVTFSSISGSYTDLVLVMAGTATTNLTSQLRFNGSSTGYSFTYLNGNGSSASSGYSTSTNVVALGEFYTGGTNVIAQINNYSNSTTYKTVLSRGNTPSSYVQAIVSLWQSTAAVTSIDIYAEVGSGKTFASGCVFTLYGIKAA